MFNKTIIPAPLTKVLITAGIFGITLWTLPVFDFIYVYALRRSGLKRYQHAGPKPPSTSNAQDSKAWALVTGASDGLGLQIAKELARAGFNVVLHGRNPSKLNQKVAQLQSKFPSTSFRTVVADASKLSEDSTKQLIADIASEMANLPGPLTILVNNVGGLPNPQRTSWQAFDVQEPSDIDAFIDMNLRFTTQITRALLPVLKFNAPGLVIVIGAAAGDMAVPYLPVYSGAKAFLKVWTIALSEELKMQGTDVEFLGINVQSVTDTAGKDDPVSMMVPSANTMARAVLDRVGCGKTWLWGYWGHAVQGAMLGLMPGWFMHGVVVRGYVRSMMARAQSVKKTD